MVCIYSIILPHCDSFSQKLSQYGEKILYSYVYQFINYIGNCEALHEITDLVHEMLSVCAPLQYTKFLERREERYHAGSHVIYVVNNVDDSMTFRCTLDSFQQLSEMFRTLDILGTQFSPHPLFMPYCRDVRRNINLKGFLNVGTSRAMT